MTSSDINLVSYSESAITDLLLKAYDTVTLMSTLYQKMTNLIYLFFCTIARKNKTKIASVIDDVITDP
jgi:hypothetical protein